MARKAADRLYASPRRRWHFLLVLALFLIGITLLSQATAAPVKAASVKPKFSAKKLLTDTFVNGPRKAFSRVSHRLNIKQRRSEDSDVDIVKSLDEAEQKTQELFGSSITAASKFRSAEEAKNQEIADFWRRNKETPLLKKIYAAYLRWLEGENKRSPAPDAASEVSRLPEEQLMPEQLETEAIKIEKAQKSVRAQGSEARRLTRTLLQAANHQFKIAQDLVESVNKKFKKIDPALSKGYRDLLKQREAAAKAKNEELKQQLDTQLNGEQYKDMRELMNEVAAARERIKKASDAVANAKLEVKRMVSLTRPWWPKLKYTLVGGLTIGTLLAIMSVGMVLGPNYSGATLPSPDATGEQQEGADGNKGGVIDITELLRANPDLLTAPTSGGLKSRRRLR